MEGSISIFEFLYAIIGLVFDFFSSLLGNLYFLPIIISVLFFGVFLIRSVLNYDK